MDDRAGAARTRQTALVPRAETTRSDPDRIRSSVPIRRQASEVGRTLLDVIRRRAESDKDRDGFVFLSYRGSTAPAAARLSFGELERRARRIAAALQQRCGKGDRALILCPPGLDYIAAFYGCVMAGVVTVPAYPPRNARQMGRLATILADATASVILTTADLSERLLAWASADLSLPWRLAVDGVESDHRDDWRDPGVGPDDLVFLQYTSGTTAAPQGVMVAHAQLLANVERIAAVADADATSIGVLWLPPYHDMGLMAGLVLPVCIGLSNVFMSPMSFLQAPLRWLEAISTYRATLTIAPNFAYRLCVDQVAEADIAGLDLASLRVAGCAAEIVRHETLRDFAERFRAVGFQSRSFIPSYGLAEVVVLATAVRAADAAPTLAVSPIDLTAGRVVARERLQRTNPAPTSDGITTAVSCGRVIAGHELRIVDPETRQERPAGEVGEIWLSGPSVAAGYWRKPQATQETFKARLASSAGADPEACFLRTGDLGAIVAEELYVLGRIKEMVIVRGCNHYATDLETTASASHAAFGADRMIAFAVEDEGEERLVLMHELSRAALRDLDAPALFRAIRSAVVAGHEIDPSAIALVRPAALPRTTSGKLQRGKAREQYLAGELAVIAEWRASTLAGDRIDPAVSRATADRVIGWLRDYAPENINSFEIDERRTVQPAIIMDFGRQGLFGLRVPVEQGGLGLSFKDTARIGEQLAAIDPTLMVMLGQHNILALQPLLMAGTAEQRQRFLPELASGRSLIAFALSEPGAGSNPRALRTVARADGAGRWRLTGQKSWTGLGSWARYVMVVCRLHDAADRFQGYGIFLIERGTAGFRVGPESLTLGLRGFPQSTLFFDNVSVDSTTMIGLPGEGMQLALHATALGRMNLAALCLGGMKRCAQLMVRYAQRRRIGTGLLIDNGVTRHRLDLVLARIAAVAAFVDHGCAVLDQGRALPEDLYSVAKMSAPEFFWDAADGLIQTLGGRGYEEPNEAARLLRDARVLRIGEGPTETVGVYLGIRLLEEKSDLLAHLSTALEAERCVERIGRCRSGLLASAVAAGRRWGEAEAFALAEVATAATLLAIVESRDLGSTSLQAVPVLEAQLSDAEARASRMGLLAVSTAAQLTETIAGFAATIGDIDKQAADAQRAPDPYLLCEPQTPPLVEVLRHRTLAQYRDSVERHWQPMADDFFPGGTLLLVREVVAELTGLPTNVIGVETSFEALGMDSIVAVRLVSRLAEATGKELAVRAVFEHPTVAGLAEALDALAAGDGLTAIEPVDRSGPLPLSFQQERLWFLSRLDAGAGVAYNITGALRLRGMLDVAALAAALSDVVSRHESLRTRFAVVEGRPVQVIEAVDRFALAGEEASGLSEAALAERVAALVGAPFDLEHGPLFRAYLLRLGEDDQVLVAGGHHTVLDGWSVGVLLREVSILYGARLRGETAGLAGLSIQYADYAAWQRATLSGERLAQQTEYWREQLRGVPPAIALPTDRPRPAVMDYRGGSVEFRVPAGVTSRLTVLARGHSATLFMVLQAAFAALLHRLGGDEDLVIGAAVAGRGRVELEPLVGFFVNTLALRHRVRGEMAFSALLDATRDVVLSAFEHQDVPFEAVVEAVGPERSLSHERLLQVMLVLQNQVDAATERELVLPEVSVVPFVVARESAPLELLVDVTETAAGLEGRLIYASALFDAASARRLAERFCLLLSGIAAAPETQIAELPVMAAAERALVVSGFNATAADYPRDRTVVELFEVQAARVPDALAVVDGVREVGYGALASASRRLGRHLIGLGVGPETVVGVCLEHSADLIVALLGVFQAGGAYLPLDPEYPPARLRLMLADAAAPVLIATRTYAERLADAQAAGGDRPDTRLVIVDDAATAAAIARLSDMPLGDAERTAPLTPDSLAYVIYTSGSTGRPKGVMVGHREFSNFLLATQDDLKLDGGTVLLSLASSSFDLSIEEFCVPLVIGGYVVMADRRRLAEAGYVGQLVDQTGVTMIDTTPAVWKMLIADGWRPGSRVSLLSSAEVAPSKLANELGERGATLWNSYGPTETAIMVTTHRVAEVNEVIPIGSPMANTQIYVVDARFELQPVGVAGELLIGGAQVGRGYLGRPGLTAERFVADPFSGVAGSRLYRTGDRARWRADGTLEFLGRLDHQVKIRGMRVELGEIEAALGALPGVAQSAVSAQEMAAGDTRLVAYLVPSPPPSAAGGNQAAAGPAAEVVALEGTIDLEAARAALRRVLPEHMMPSGYVGLNRLPLTPSGKLDRQALPAVAMEVAAAAYVAPRTATEVMVAAAFEDLLGVSRVGARDGFFDLGGHSLLAVRLVSRLAEATGKELAVRAVFEHPTVAGLAAALVEDGIGADVMRPREFWSGEAELPADIQFSGTPEPLMEVGDILLTGATGFLGAFLASELLRCTRARLHCVVRARDIAEATSRLRDNLRSYGVWEDGFADRITPVLGDIGASRLGIEEAAYETLAGRVGAVLHNGALVNFVFPYEMLKTANVGGTLEILRFAGRGRPKTIHYISTASVFAPEDADDEGVLRETAVVGYPERLRGGYAQSKWVAEQLVFAAFARGLYGEVYRIGRIAGHAETGRHQVNDLLFRLLRTCIALGSAPEIENRIPMAPVDFVARAVVSLASRRTEVRVYHIDDCAPMSACELIDAVRSFGYRLAPVDLQSWRRTILEAGRQDLDTVDADVVFAISQIAEEAHNAARQYRVATTQTMAMLATHGISPSPIREAQIHRYLGFFVSVGFLPAPIAFGTVADTAQ